LSEVLEAVNKGWRWAGTTFVAIHAQSPMGHLVLSDAEGCFHYLDTDGMELIPLGNKAALDAHFAVPENIQLWEASGLVDPARERLGEPSEGKVFALSPTDWIEGNYAPDRICHLPLKEIVFLSGDLARQLKDLPDGTQIRIEIRD
jgi:hypothetical protein